MLGDHMRGNVAYAARAELDTPIVNLGMHGIPHQRNCCVDELRHRDIAP